jgi:hypothetical protein
MEKPDIYDPFGCAQDKFSIVDCRFFPFLAFICVHLRSSAVNEVEKTKPIYSFCVQRAACCVMEIEKTKPIL